LDEPVQVHPEGDAAINQLKSPFCPGLMLEVCSHPQSKLLRDTIPAMANAGTSSDSLVAWMLTTYGEEYRAVPLTSGKGLWAWLMPPLGLLAGLLLVIVALKQFRARQVADSTPARPLTEEDESVLAAAMKELKAAEEVPF
jgi:cytochrome c-type biogenesis protein CcmH/NrfF